MNDAPMPTPAERLDASREHVRAALRVAALARGGGAAAGSGAPWLDTLKSIPGSRLAIAALQGWWTKHPLHVTAQVFSAAVQALVRPLAQRHPIALVGGALLVGGLLAAGRPWRWILTPTLLAGLLPQLLSKAVALVPAQSWLAVVAALAQPPQAGSPARAAPAPTPSPGTEPPRSPAPPLSH